MNFFFFVERINIDEMDVQIRAVWAQIDLQPKNFGQWLNKLTTINLLESGLILNV